MYSKPNVYVRQFSAILFIGTCVCYSIASQQALAAITVSGDVLEAPVLLSLVRGAFEDDEHIAFFMEKSDFTLTNDLPFDVDGTAGVYSDRKHLRPGILSEGTRVNSYLLHFDPVGNPPQGLSRNGSITFSEGPIIALMLLGSSLATSDILGVPGTIYGGGFRGFEFVPGHVVSDQVTISSDRRTVTVNFGATSQFDQLRVITNIPEPSTLFLCCSLTFLCLAKRRRLG